MRVAFFVIGGKNWTGGYNYLLNLLGVLASETPDAVQLLLFAGEDVPEVELAPFRAIRGCEVVQAPVFNDVSRSRLLRRGLVLGQDSEAVSIIRKLGVDAVFESALFLGWRLATPAIAWIPDFQHRYFPEHFSRVAWWKREVGFRAQIRSGRTVMVSSEDSKRDCQRFYPDVAGRVHAVRFAVRPPPPMSDEEARRVADRYGLPERFFFMPNQFWAHKNHMLVVQALKLLRARGESITVVATGKQLDPRNAEYVPMLKAAVKDAGLEAEFRMPGLIPYDDLMPLMQASTALLNPSLFEGWSTTVEEARAAGVPLVLSDLPVHQEQAGEQATYFDRHSAVSLAEILSTFVTLPRSERLALRNAARIEAQSRVKRFADDFVLLVQSATERRHNAI